MQTNVIQTFISHEDGGSINLPAVSELKHVGTALSIHYLDVCIITHSLPMRSMHHSGADCL